MNNELINSLKSLKEKHAKAMLALEASRKQSEILFNTLIEFINTSEYPLLKYERGGKHHVYLSIGINEILLRSEIELKHTLNMHTQVSEYSCFNRVALYLINDKRTRNLMPLPLDAWFDSIGNYIYDYTSDNAIEFCVKLLIELTKRFISDRSFMVCEESELRILSSRNEEKIS